MASDDELLDLIGQATSVAPPAHLVRAAYASRSWADIDSELAALVQDTANLAVAGVRADQNRRLIYESSCGVVDVELDAQNNQLIVRTEPAATISLEFANNTARAEAQTVSQTQAFVDYTGSGPARLLLQSAAGDWRTGWFTV